MIHNYLHLISSFSLCGLEILKLMSVVNILQSVILSVIDSLCTVNNHSGVCFFPEKWSLEEIQIGLAKAIQSLSQSRIFKMKDETHNS